MTTRTLICGLAAVLVLSLADELGSENVQLTTYYPAPSGIYTQMITTGKTLLAQNAGSVGIGVAVPAHKLDIAGGGGNTVDLAVTGQIQTGDATGKGAVWLNNAATMAVGQNGAASVGFFNGAAWRLGVAANGQTTIVGPGSANADLVTNGRLQTGADGNGNGGVLFGAGAAPGMFVGQSGTDINITNTGHSIVLHNDGKISFNCSWQGFGVAGLPTSCPSPANAVSVEYSNSVAYTLNGLENAAGAFSLSRIVIYPTGKMLCCSIVGTDAALGTEH